MKFTKSNILMKQCLSEIDKYWKDYRKYCTQQINHPDITKPKYSSFDSLPGDAMAFTHLLLADINIDRGCYFLSHPANQKKNINPEAEFVPDYPTDNRSFHEDLENHFHLTHSFIRKGTHELGVLITGLGIVEILCLKLKNKFPNEHFSVSISYPVKPIDTKDKHIFDDCRISFNALRANEEVTSDIEEFKFEAVGVVEW